MSTKKVLLRCVETHLRKMNDAAINAVSHVGMANYRERRQEAESWVEKAYQDALDAIRKEAE